MGSKYYVFFKTLKLKGFFLKQRQILSMGKWKFTFSVHKEKRYEKQSGAFYEGTQFYIF